MGLILLGCFVSGIALELVADYYRSAFEVQPWDPASGLYVALLFGLGLRYFPIVFLITLSENWLWSLGGENTVPSGIAAGLYLCAGYYGASFLLLRRIKIDPGLRQLRDVLWFAGVFAVISLIMSSLHATTLALMNKMPWSDWLLNTLHDWAGEITGIMVLAPPLLILLRSLPWSNRHLTLQGPAPMITFALLSKKEALEWCLIIAASLTFTWLAFGGLQQQAPSLEYSYLTFVPLIWMAARHGFEKTTVITLLINIFAVVFVGANLSTNTLALQFGLMTVTFTGLLLGAYVRDRKAEIARRQALEQELSHRATHDPLTGLSNRARLWEHLEQAIALARSDETYLFALLFLDLDRFKGINDSLGHLIGDRLLVAVSNKIIGTVPAEATVARFGGDEFAVVLDRLTGFHEATHVAQQLCKTLASSYSLEAYEAFTTVSIGIATSAIPRERPEEMLRDADIALYEAKRRGRDQAVVFNRQMYEAVVLRSQLENDLRQAIRELEDD
ncbi:MAG: diguanylate cyclase [Elainellaceae cyanobacterium]